VGLPDDLSDAERQRLERLALADWSEAARAHVHSIIVLGRKAAVNLLLNGDYAYSVYFQQDERGQWDEAGSSSGHADISVLEAIDERP
jgi:hypothetical protein